MFKSLFVLYMIIIPHLIFNPITIGLETTNFKTKDINTNSTYNNLYRRNADISLDTILDFISLAKFFYSLLSEVLNSDIVKKLLKKEASLGLFESLPDTYDFKEDKGYEYIFPYSVTRCYISAGYAAALMTTYRKYIKEGRKKNDGKGEFNGLAAITIMENFGRCNKFNILDALNFIKENGLLTDMCRDEVFCTKCKYNQCFDLDHASGYVNAVTKETYKGGEPYKIEKQKNIQIEIYKKGPVVISYDFYDDLLDYRGGLIKKVKGKKIGTQEAVVYGWDKDGWLAQGTYGDFWGTDGDFRVSFDNNFNFGEIAFANEKEIIKISYSIIILIIILLM